jgi:hypothetical protein
MSKAAELAALVGSGQAQGNKNLVINGAMTVDQRNQTTTATGYTVDRFSVAKSNFDELVIAITQDTDNPSGNGFAHSLKLAVTTAESAIAADELLYLDTRFEGQNIQHLCYGTSSAKSLTLSFWVKSPLAGKHSVNFYQSTPVRSNLQSYTVSSANTWEYKTITIDGDTSGNIANDTTAEIILFWPLAGGSNYHGTPHTGWGAYTETDDFMFSDQVNLAGQTGNFFLTGVQLEVGEVATAFEHEDFGTTLAKCQRYFENLTFQDQSAITIGVVYSSATDVAGDLRYKVEKRAAPTIGVPTVGRSSGNINYLNANAGFVATSDGTITAQSIGVDSCKLFGDGYNVFNANGDASFLYSNGINTFTIDAEL